SAEILTDDNGTVKIHATIDGHSLSITEGSLRRHLKLDDQDGITSLPTTEIFAQLALMGYATDSDKLTFQKEVTPTELIQDQEASGKASDEVSTAGLKKGPVSEEVPTVSTAEATLSTAGGTVTYSRKIAEKRSRKDKGKAILIEEEPPKKKSKKDLEQE
ncbi:hypothetical protein Tco_0043514, partial [Tanacetum coccineum]